MSSCRGRGGGRGGGVTKTDYNLYVNTSIQLRPGPFISLEENFVNFRGVLK